jgi:L-aspartate oxidase
MKFDVAIVGSGLAGLSVALHLAETRKVVVISKRALHDGASNWAQGGIAAVLDSHDSQDEHVSDTLVAGAGLCDETATRFIVSRGREAIEWLIAQGVPFTRDESAELGFHLTREGGHSQRRIIHAADATGHAVQVTLEQKVRQHPNITLLEHHIAIDLITSDKLGMHNGAPHCFGLYVQDVNSHTVMTIAADHTVLATGGAGKVYLYTTNPDTATGDGIAMAWRAGCRVANMEFIQFHPTVLWSGPEATGQQALISEAVRGEGAILLDAAGQRVMAGVHPQEDLAPRDVVASAISSRMSEAPAGVDDHVYLDARKIAKFDERFPSITASCLAAGIDPKRELIPVAPAAHYVCGGVKATLDGATSLQGLYVVGEAACTGVHGANRLASNSLTEGVVAGTRVGRALSWKLPEEVQVVDEDLPGTLIDSYHRAALRTAMSRYVGVLRTPDGLRQAARILNTLGANASADVVPTRKTFEATNMLTLAIAVVEAAQTRQESRGCHRRTDFTEPRTDWLHHLSCRIVDGRVEVTA